jgi:hypothetical protein
VNARHRLLVATAVLAAAFGMPAQAQYPAQPVQPAQPAAQAAPVAPAIPARAPWPTQAPPAAPSAPAPPAAPAGEGRLYTPGAFEGVEIGGAAEVRYVQGDVDQVWVAGPPEVQRSLNMDLQGRLLRIQSEGGWRFWTSRRLQVQITSRTLNRLAILGAADVTAAGPVKGDKLTVHISGAGLARFDQLNVDQLSFSVSGAGDGQVAGQVRELSVIVSGKGEFRGEDLQAQHARLTISGIGDVKVWAVEELGITVAGIGQVEYWGSPRVRQRTSGPSSITPRGPKLPTP